MTAVPPRLLCYSRVTALEHRHKAQPLIGGDIEPNRPVLLGHSNQLRAGSSGSSPVIAGSKLRTSLTQLNLAGTAEVAAAA